MLQLKSLSISTCIACFVLCLSAQAQTRNVARTISNERNNDQGVQLTFQKQSEVLGSNGKVDYLWFQGATVDFAGDQLPYYNETRRLPLGTTDAQVAIKSASYETASRTEAALVPESSAKSIKSAIQIEKTVSYSRGVPYLILRFVPLRNNPSSGQMEKLVSFDLEVTPIKGKRSRVNGAKNFVANSKLANGEWYKFGITEDGVYRLTYQWLTDMGIDLENVTPDQINIYGNGYGMLPQRNSEYRPDDLLLNKIVVSGDDDGTFDNGDYILFYGKGPNVWRYDSLANSYTHDQHQFSDTAFYYLGLNVDPAARITSVNGSTASSNQTVTTFDDFQYHERDWVNLIKSGARWYGEYFSDVNLNRTVELDFPDLDATAPARVTVDLVSRTIGTSQSTDFNINYSGTPATNNMSVTGVSGHYTADFARPGTVTHNLTPNAGNKITVGINFDPNSATSEAWLNFGDCACTSSPSI